MKKFLKPLASILLALSFASVNLQMVSSAVTTVSPGSANLKPTSPVVKKGQKVIIIVKDTKNQKVVVYDNNAKKTGKFVKMGTKFVVKAVKKVNGKNIVKIASNKWVNLNDVTQY